MRSDNLTNKINKIGNHKEFNELSLNFDFWLEVIEKLHQLNLINLQSKNKLLILYETSVDTVEETNNEFILMVNLIYNILFNK